MTNISFSSNMAGVHMVVVERSSCKPRGCRFDPHPTPYLLAKTPSSVAKKWTMTAGLCATTGGVFSILKMLVLS